MFAVQTINAISYCLIFKITIVFHIGLGWIKRSQFLIEAVFM